MTTLDNHKFIRLMVSGVLVILVLLVIIWVGGQDNDDTPRLISSESGRRSLNYAGSADMGMVASEARSNLDNKMIAPSPWPPRGGGQTAAEAEPRVIKTADLSLGVNGVPEKTADIANLAKSQGGFVESSTVVEDQAGYKTGYITVRVPVDKFDEAVTAIKNLAVRVEMESINGRDVTEQYTDLEARLRSAKAQEEQYLTILQQATTVQDILAVQQYLQNIRYEIESLQGQLDSLGNQTEYSTISVTLTEETRVRIPAEKFDLGRDIKQAALSVVLLAQAAITFLVYFIIVGGAIVIPLGLILALVIWVIRKIVRRL